MNRKKTHNTTTRSTKIHDSLLSEILDLPSGSFQEFLDSILTTFERYAPRSASLYSPLVENSACLELIAYSGKITPTSLPLSKLTLPFTLTTTVELKENSLVFLLSCSNQPPPSIAIQKAIRHKIQQIIYYKKQYIRRLVIEQSIKSRDVNSFVFRLVSSLQQNIIYSADISLFLHDISLDRLFLSGSTSELRGIEKKDIYYSIDSDGPTSKCFQKNIPTMESINTNFSHEEFDSNIFRSPLQNRSYWPINLDSSYPHTTSIQKLTPIGVFRVTNIQRKDKHTFRLSAPTEYDIIFITFVQEVIFVLLQQYIQASISTFDTGRLTHGLAANIDAAHKFALLIFQQLFSPTPDEESHIPRFSLRYSGITDTQDVYVELRDLLMFLEDAEFQLEKSQGNGTHHAAESIKDFHSTVLMPSIRLTAAIAAVNSKPNPHISNMKEAGSMDLPAIWGNREALISVFRNLFENSIKYTRRGPARIDMKFSPEAQHVVIDYFDGGIGIKTEEREQIFVEGYRSVTARRTSNRGIGVGLSYSRDTLRSFGGDIECISHSNGAHFKITLKRG